ncbi:DUF2214 domain-containing protein [Roseibium salinum]|uniref:DUF2214 domain-containing protein n=1 Tax=Roseibium salinum TaxID=1604349 RepID=A0ABT3QYW8_9HYPH|nr:DUF2214 domain-containing protein [Roseibium sp. DSM 29163]MCX2722033.1 DUF2214 domain-containing protein [Roseibium sp. DSM 29163]MDN3719950.1 DUF2214 domain-containing protein [Roseibium salinum]
MTDLLLDLAGWVSQTDLAVWLRRSRWGYAFVNGTHVLGIALLVGAIVPMDLRLIGVGSGLPVAALARRLVPVAATGLALAVLTGAFMLSLEPVDYLRMPVVQIKLSLVAIGSLSAILTHLRYGWWMAGAPERSLRTPGLISLCCWLPALFAGRLIAFLGS